MDYVDDGGFGLRAKGARTVLHDGDALPRDLSDVLVIVERSDRWWERFGDRLFEVAHIFFFAVDEVDLTPLVGSPNLKFLDLDVVNGARVIAKVDASNWHSLEEFRGNPANLEGLFALESITRATIARYRGKPRVRWSLESLVLHRMPAADFLQAVRSTVSLRSLELEGLTLIDLSWLPPAARVVRIHSAKKVTGAVPAGMRLTKLVLTDCPFVEDPSALFRGAIERLELIGATPFRSGRRWSVGEPALLTNENDRTARWLLVHPALEQPLSYPNETLGSGPADMTSSAWDAFTDTHQTHLLVTLLRDLVAPLMTDEDTEVLADGSVIGGGLSWLVVQLEAGRIPSDIDVRSRGASLFSWSEPSQDGVVVREAHWAAVSA